MSDGLSRPMITVIMAAEKAQFGQPGLDVWPLGKKGPAFFRLALTTVAVKS
jgi:hypothetical protein